MELLYALFICLSLLVSTAKGLWPIPRNLETGNSFIKLHNSFKISLDGNISRPPQDLLDAIERTMSFLRNDKLQRLVVGRGAADRGAIGSASALQKLLISINSDDIKPIGEEAVKDVLQRNEAYSLSVPADGGGAVIRAETTLGVLRGLTTFSQLWYDDGQGVTYAFGVPVNIENDSPAFPYRGFMLDTSRHFFKVDDIKRMLDVMSWVKLNMFHWHAVDSQSFPISIAEFPEVAAKGAYSSQETYSTDNIQDIVSYAAARGIDVLLEIDTPGHTAAIADSHPEHMACPFGSPWRTFAGEPPAGQLRLASAETTNFTTSLITAIAKTLPSKFFSTGGDEINLNCYANDSATQADLQRTGRTLEQALNDFTQSTHGALRTLGKFPVVWEEMALEHEVDLHNDTVVMVWISSQHVAAVAAQNLRIVHAASDFFYLDCGAGGWIGNNPNGGSSCAFRSWQQTYTFDPFANLTQEQHSLILGGQQLMWTEQTSPENLDPIVWPRAATSAEIFWTGATLPDGSPRNVASALPRLHDIRYRMVQRGINAIALQPEWCALRPNTCDVNA
ncbi:glycoside hydrolase family 20 protein [Amanita thiersii Skay4041]|uniref:Beta-hexosaminidase n=1 Tax=Amanita thiersii Skay4041 TaxID=703135 RepID=A0A2A9P0G5_9AGAR|nr:glycoside hydrolase family 20 protein [Amanita thiersii Skay4041]